MVYEITNEEKIRRQNAVDFARANVGLEGFKLGKTWEDLAQRFINGELELSRLVGENIVKLV